MLGSRRNRPSLIGRAAHTAARTAVIAGTATAVSGAVASRQMAKAAEAMPPVPAAPVAAPAAAPAALSLEAIDRLRDLAELHQKGVLTDAEFALQKARLIG